MDWIKRNLYFLIGSLVALALMGLAGWYLYSKWQLNNTILGSLDEQYATLRRLYEQKPHPGSDKVDNIKAAKDQQQELLECRRHFADMGFRSDGKTLSLALTQALGPRVWALAARTCPSVHH